MRLASLIGLLFYAGVLTAGETGNLTGRIVLKGSPPAAEPFNLGRDVCCIEANPKDERWLVGPKGGLANVVVSLRLGRDELVPDSEKGSSNQTALSLTNRDCRFEPRVLIMQTGQTLKLVNDDPTTHNVAATFGRNVSFNVVLAPESSRDFLLDQPERKPMPVSCNIHPYMRGYVFVSDHPYAAISEADGRFSIANLPAGDWQFQFWHEGKYLKGMVFSIGEIPHKTDQRGRIQLKIKPQATLDLGDMNLQLSE